MNRQKVILALLLVVFAGSLVYSYLRSPKQLQGPPRAATRAAAPAARAKGAAAPAVRDQGSVRIDLLERETARFGGYRRNIFSPIFREEVKTPPFKPLPPPPKPVSKQLPPPPPPVQGPPVQAAPPPPTPEQLADAEMGKITFLGFLKKNGDKTVFLSHNNEIFLAKKGSRIGSNYVVSDLTDDAITIKSVAGGREVVIPLAENRSLSKRRPSKWTTPP